MLDYIIVGQGIAGSMLGWFLEKAGKQFVLLEQDKPNSSSLVAAGLLNPITGRKFSKTWLAEEIFPFAESTYHEIENKLQQTLYQSFPLLHLFDSVKAQNDWSLRCASPGYTRFLKSEEIIYLDNKKVKNDFGAFEVGGAGRMYTEKLVPALRTYFQQQGKLRLQRFEQRALKLIDDGVQYEDLTAHRIIFCEGAAPNSFFTEIPYQYAKGECLLVRIKDFYPEYIIKGDAGIIPWTEKDIYYIGATHHWHFTDEQPSPIGRQELEQNLQQVLRLPYEVIDHRAAIRPATHGRRPFIGLHPEHKQIGILNGLGTKGFSLAPYFAQHLVEHLEKGTALLPEVDVQRIYKAKA